MESSKSLPKNCYNGGNIDNLAERNLNELEKLLKRDRLDQKSIMRNIACKANKHQKYNYVCSKSYIFDNGTLKNFNDIMVNRNRLFKRL